jgi:SRSO17 transposase
VFLSYSSPKGHTLLDRELDLPEDWAADAARRTEAGVPPEVKFATKPQLAQRMLQRVLTAQVAVSWVTGDEVYGRDRRLRMWLEEQQQPFVLTVASNEPLWFSRGRGPEQVPAAEIAAGVEAEYWQRLSAGAGAKGPRLYDWVRVSLTRWSQPPWGHWLLVRRSPQNPTNLAYYVVFGPADTSLEQMVAVAGQRWTVEESLEVAKGEVGLDQYEVRHWVGWYRHITLAMLAQAYRNVIRLQASAAECGKKGRPTMVPTCCL